METNIKLLEVGMYIFNYRSYGGLNRHKVTRVTPKQAEAEGITVKRDIVVEKDFSGKERFVVKKIGEYGNCYLQTAELLDEWKEYNITRKAMRLHRDFKIDNITPEQAKKLIALYEEIQPEPVKTS